MTRLLTSFALAILLGGATADPVAAQTAPAVSPAPRTAPSPAPNVDPADLIVANRKIVTFRTGLGVISPAARVALVQGRIRELEKSDFEQPVTSKAGNFAGHQAYALEINGKPLLAILPEDLDPVAGERLEDVVQRAVAELNAAREAYLELHRASFIAKQAALAAVPILAFAFAWYVLARVRNRVRNWVNGIVARQMESFSPKGLDLANFGTAGAGPARPSRCARSRTR